MSAIAPCGATLVRPVSAIAWELRAAWAVGRRVVVTLERADLARLEGWVTRVSPTGVSAEVGGTMFPLDRVLAVHKPSRLGDSTVRDGAWRGPARREGFPGQGELPVAAEAPR